MSHDKVLVPSAIRAPGQSWQEALLARPLHTRASVETSAADSSEAPDSAMKVARTYDEEMDFARLPDWPYDKKKLLEVMRVVRDDRRYFHPENPKFARRALWLYPYNGCFVRAAVIAQKFEEKGLPRPGKVYAIGDLKAKTKYDQRGWVYWSYHVAPAYRVGGEVIVMDPALAPTRLLRFKEWLKLISVADSSVKVAVCSTYSYSPIDSCLRGERDQERSTVSHLISYLPDEWKRLTDLGYEAERLLGDEPPWRPLDQLANGTESDNDGGNDHADDGLGNEVSDNSETSVGGATPEPTPVPTTAPESSKANSCRPTG